MLYCIDSLQLFIFSQFQPTPFFIVFVCMLSRLVHHLNKFRCISTPFVLFLTLESYDQGYPSSAVAVTIKLSVNDKSVLLIDVGTLILS